ncbi:MAG: protein kinase [Nannocystaceae bacterium]|nr:protein kinase [Nannocystaceae bacterium]
MGRHDSDAVGVDALRGGTTERGSGPRVGHYHLLDTVGEGGMGRVFLAYDPKLHRRVAIKLLKSDATGGSAARLMREAQALAQVSHPNLVHVYEVGEQAGEVFVVMEYIRGETLTQWLAQRRRSWREIVAVLAGAGAGLAAAHRARIVHRDFKPANVVIDRDGVARVVDFGIAVFGASAETGMESSGVLGDTRARARDAALSLHVTDGGSVMGTPPYMAPEQHAGRRADARSDQFSFAVTLFEALYQTRPFPDDDEAMLAAKRAGEIRFPAEAAVPSRVRTLLRRALAPDPEQRFASMQALLDALQRSHRWVWGALGGAAVLAAATGLYLSRTRAPADACTNPPPRAAAVWDDARKAAVAAAFAAIDHPYAEPSRRTVEAMLDQQLADWRGSWQRSCVATQVERTQSQELFDLRMACLERRLDGVAALVDVLANADVRVVERAVLATANLTPVAVCDDETLLRDEVPPPEDPRTREQVDEIRAALSGVEALVDAGRFDDAKLQAERLADRARTLGYRPLVAEAELVLGAALENDPRAAEHALRASIRAATESRHDLVAARAWNALVENVGIAQARHEEALSLATGAEAAVARVDPDGGLTATLAAYLGSIASARGNYDEAITQYARAERLVTAAYGDQDPRLRVFVNNLGVVLLQQGKWDEALVQFERALALGEATLGPEHPYLADYVMNIGNVQLEQRDGRHARVTLERALAILSREPEANRRRIAMVRANLANAMVLEGEYDEAEATASTARAQLVTMLGVDHPHVAGVDDVLGSIALQRGQLDVAATTLDDARVRLERALGPRHPLVALVRLHHAEVALERGEFAAAQRELIDAEAVLREDPGAEHPDHAVAAALLAEAQLAQGGGQIEPLTRAIAGMRPLDAHARARARYALARAQLAASPDDAISDATAALAELTRPDYLQPRLRAWLSQHLRGRAARVTAGR